MFVCLSLWTLEEVRWLSLLLPNLRLSFNCLQVSGVFFCLFVCFGERSDQTPLKEQEAASAHV